MNFSSENKYRIQTLPNGLKVKMIEKPNFQVFNVQLSVNFGSISKSCKDNTSIPGLAHLMEHLLFHKKNREITSDFSNLGIDVNAYTTYNYTNFFYNIVDKDRKVFKKALEYLFDLVSKPYFDDDQVKKEAQIINSEIKLTQDDLDSELYMEFLNKLYPGTPLGYDILGTPDTLKQITNEKLIQFHNEFYQPSNMILYVCGPMSLNELSKILNLIDLPKKGSNQLKNQEYYYVPDLVQDKLPENKLTKLVYGWSLPNLKLDYRESLIFSLFLENMLGKRSHFFHRMFNEGIINDDFYYEFIVEKNFTVIFFSCLTEFPEKITNTTLETFHQIKISEEKLKITIKNFIGKYIQTFDSIDELSTLENDGKFHLEDAINSLKIVDNLEVGEVKEVAEKVLRQSEFATAWKLIS